MQSLWAASGEDSGLGGPWAWLQTIYLTLLVQLMFQSILVMKHRRLFQWQNDCSNYFFNSSLSLFSLSKQTVTHKLYLVIHNCYHFNFIKYILKLSWIITSSSPFFWRHSLSWRRLIACRYSFLSFTDLTSLYIPGHILPLGKTSAVCQGSSWL